MAVNRRLFCMGAVSMLVSAKAMAADLGPDIIAKAKAEGRVVWYTDLIVDQVVRPIASAFRAAYGIDLVYTRGDSQDTLLKVLNEHKAGRPSADMFSVTSGMQELIDAGAVDEFDCPNAEALPAGYSSAAHQWIATNIYSLTPAVNTDLVTDEVRPKDYDDLLLPRWTGKMVWKPK